jgi:hypothetical protein
MKLASAAVVLVGLVWLGLWLANTGILVYSADTGVLKTRDCRYLVGVTVSKRLHPVADRCPLVRKLGA